MQKEIIEKKYKSKVSNKNVAAGASKYLLRIFKSNYLIYVSIKI